MYNCSSVLFNTSYLSEFSPSVSLNCRHFLNVLYLKEGARLKRFKIQGSGIAIKLKPGLKKTMSRAKMILLFMGMAGCI